MTYLPQLMRIAVLVPAIAGISIGYGQTNYYSKSTGNLNLVASWGTNTDGSGTAPGNFTANNQVFNVRNNASPTIAANWTVSGANSKVVVGDGSTATNFQIPSGFKLTGKADVAANATLSIANTTNPTMGTLNPASTVIFNGTSNQTIPGATYGNLTYSGSATGTMAGSCTIAGNLSITNGNVILDNANNTSYTHTVTGSFNVTTGGNVDFGSGNGSGTATVNLSGNLSQTGSGYIQTSGSVPNGIINFAGTAQTAQMADGEYINYNINSGSTLTLAANFTYGGATGYSSDFTVNSGGTLDCGTYLLIYENLGGTPATSFTLSSGASLITANTAGISTTAGTGSIQVVTTTFSSGANYTYDGTAAQVTGVFPTSPTASTLNNLTINNAAGVTLSQAESVAGVLTLTSGLLTTTSTNLITVNNAATVTGASNTSFVNGPITKLGKQAFTFPVGVAGTGYVPIAISAPASTTDAFFAQYVRSGASALGSVSAAGLNHVSGCDYWTLNHTAGASSVNVTGYWNANSPCGNAYVNDLTSVALAHFNGTSWNAYGNSSVSGTTASGSVTWTSVSTFSPFALGSTNSANPLPIILAGFNAKWQDNATVALSWETQQESNSNHFAVQRCSDGVSWQTIGMVQAAGSSPTLRSYAYLDKEPQPALDYYRLQLVDNDGSMTYSEVKLVSRSTGNTIHVFPNPASDRIEISFGSAGLPGIVGIRLLDLQGRSLIQKKLVDPAGQTISLSVSGYSPGSYIVQLFTAAGVQQSKVIEIKR